MVPGDRKRKEAIRAYSTQFEGVCSSPASSVGVEASRGQGPGADFGIALGVDFNLEARGIGEEEI